MKLKRTSSGLLALSMLVALCVPLTGCAKSSSSSSAQKVTLNFYIEGDTNVQDALTTMCKSFTAKNPNIDVKVEASNSDTAARSKLIAAVKAGQKTTDMDILETSDTDMTTIFQDIGKDSLAPITTTQVPNLKNVTTIVKSDENRAIPYRGTTVALAYNSNNVKNPPTTADALYEWIKAHPGRFDYNDPSTGGSGEAFVVTAVYNQLPEAALTSDDASNVSQWAKGFDLLKELHPYMYKSAGKVQYPNGNSAVLTLLENNEIDMCPVWADQFLDAKAKGLMPSQMKITQITPKFTGGIQRVSIPAISNHKDAAYKLLNYMISVDGQSDLVNSLKIIPVIDISKLPKKTVDELSGFKSNGFRVFSIGSLESQLTSKWQKDIATLK